MRFGAFGPLGYAIAIGLTISSISIPTRGDVTVRVRACRSYFGAGLGQLALAPGQRVERPAQQVSQGDVGRARLQALGIRTDNLDWIRLLFPYGIEWHSVARAYVENLTYGLERFAWFFDQDDWRPEVFRGVLAGQNRDTIQGGPESSSGETYLGFAGPRPLEGLPFRSGAEAGQFRSRALEVELTWLLEPPSMTQVDRDALIEWANQAVSSETRRSWVNPGADGGNVLQGRRWTRTFLAPERIREACSQMLSELMKARRCESCSISELSVSLARYYWIAAAAHPFPRVNNSIFMSHINYVLMRFGHRGIDHAARQPFHLRLDAYALLLPFEQFSEIFVAEVARANSDGAR